MAEQTTNTLPGKRGPSRKEGGRVCRGSDAEVCLQAARACGCRWRGGKESHRLRPAASRGPRQALQRLNSNQRPVALPPVTDPAALAGRQGTFGILASAVLTHRPKGPSVCISEILTSLGQWARTTNTEYNLLPLVFPTNVFHAETRNRNPTSKQITVLAKKGGGPLGALTDPRRLGDAGRTRTAPRAPGHREPPPAQDGPAGGAPAPAARRGGERDRTGRWPEAAVSAGRRGPGQACRHHLRSPCRPSGPAPLGLTPRPCRSRSLPGAWPLHSRVRPGPCQGSGTRCTWNKVKSHHPQDKTVTGSPRQTEAGTCPRRL